MASNLATLANQVLQNTGKVGDNNAKQIAVTSLNTICKFLSSKFTPPELMPTANANTANGTRSYDMTTNLTLVRPKQILGITLISGTLSRELVYIPVKKFDILHPYPEAFTNRRSEYYTRRANSIELVPIPDGVYPLRIWYSQYPLVMVNDSDVCSYENVDELLIAGATALVYAAYEEAVTASSWRNTYTALEKAILSSEIYVEDYRPSRNMQDTASSASRGNYWLDPFVRENP